MYERNRIANVAATNLEIKIGLNGDERMEIPTTQKNLILWTGTSERSTNQFNVQIWPELSHSDGVD